MGFDMVWAAVIARFVLVPLFAFMAILFFKKYRASQNKYFNGYFVFFLLLTIVQVSVAVADIMTILQPESVWANTSSAKFPDYEANVSKLWIFFNLVRPYYILIYIVLLVALAGQIQPIEVILKQDRHILSRALFLCTTVLVLVYIPALTYSLFTIIIMSITNLLVFIGFLFNVFMNLSLALKTVGEVRKRSLLVLFGFIIFIIGTLWGLKMGWSVIFNPNWHHNEDVIIGAIISGVSIYCYYRVFASSD